MATSKKNPTSALKTFRVLAKVEVESWQDINAANFEEAGRIAESLNAESFVEVLGELFEAQKPVISDISTT